MQVLNDKLPSTEILMNYQNQFQETGHVLIPNLFSEDFLKALVDIQSKNKSKYMTIFFEDEGKKTGEELIFNSPSFRLKFDMTFQDQEIFDLIQNISGHSVNHAKPRVKKLAPSMSLGEHNDSAQEGIKVAMRTELSLESYTGGEFILKDTSGNRLNSQGAMNFGDSMFFNPLLQHQVMPVTSGNDRLSLICWFFDLPSGQ